MIRGFLIVGALLTLLAGCLRLEREYPERAFFTLEATRPEGGAAAPRFGALRLERIDISSPFQGKSFLYRTGELRYEEDFYNRFFAPPAELVTATTERWLRASALFPQIYARPAPTVPDYLLEGEIAALYGDFHVTPPRAVLAIGFTLMHEEEELPRVVLRREYRREIPLAEKTPAALAAGWSEALAQILTAFENDLRGMALP